MEDRRRYPRFRLSRGMTFSYMGCLRIGNVVDLSLGGARIETLFPIVPEQSLELWIPLINNTIRPLGKVVYNIQTNGQRYSSGISFESVNHSYYENLRDYIDTLKN